MSKKYTDEFLISELNRFLDENDKVPIANDFGSNKKFPSIQAYIHHFGSWNDALIEAGLEVNQIANYSENFLLNELKRYYNEYGKTPTEYDFMHNKNFPHYSTYINRFGSWNNALELADLKINKINDKLTGAECCEKCGSIGTTSNWCFEDNKRICHVCYDKVWRKNNPECVKKINARRKGYGYKSINKTFNNSEGHHLHLENTTEFVVYIPNFLHQLYRHNHKKPETLITINAIALDFWLNESEYMNMYLNGD